VTVAGTDNSFRNLRKVNILLAALERAKKRVLYYALDVSLNELRRTLADVPSYKYVKCAGLHATYDDGLEWLKSPAVRDKPKTIFWLGSSIGNFDRDSAHKFIKSFAEVLQPGDMMLVGIDSCTDPEKVYHAYNDKEGVTHRFILNGLVHAEKLLGSTTNLNLDDWKVIGKYNHHPARHQAFVTPLKDIVVDGVVIKKGERVRIEESHKYSAMEIDNLWEYSGLARGSSWFNESRDYGTFHLQHCKTPPVKDYIYIPCSPYFHYAISLCNGAVL
jgi:L-histidine Nalpha-methyltransferase / hercynylcysteine S-oxide synthase